MRDEWKIPAGGLPNVFWDWNDPPATMGADGPWKMPATDYPDAVERGIILLWCDDTIIPPIGQLIAVSQPDSDGQCEWSLLGPVFEVEQWLHDGRVLSYEDATRYELVARIRSFVVSPQEFSLKYLADHARFMSSCEIYHPLLTDIVVIYAKKNLAIAERCELLLNQLLSNFDYGDSAFN